MEVHAASFLLHDKGVEQHRLGGMVGRVLLHHPADAAVPLLLGDDARASGCCASAGTPRRHLADRSAP